MASCVHRKCIMAPDTASKGVAYSTDSNYIRLSISCSTTNSKKIEMVLGERWGNAIDENE